MSSTDIPADLLAAAELRCKELGLHPTMAIHMARFAADMMPTNEDDDWKESVRILLPNIGGKP